MKQNLKQISAVGSIYFALCLINLVIRYDFLSMVSLLILFVSCIYAISLAFRRNEEMTAFAEKNPELFLFMTTTGWTSYLWVPLYILGLIDGYNMQKAADAGVGYSTILSPDFYGYYADFCEVVMVVALVVAIVLVRKMKK